LDLVSANDQQRKHDKVVSFIAPHDFSLEYDSLLYEKIHGTGQWFLESTKFKNWVRGEGSVLWCPGMPGAGKSTLCAIAIEHMEDVTDGDANTAILFTFCDYRKNSIQNRLNLLASLWRQLLRRRCLASWECDELENKYEGPGRRRRPSADEMLEMLHREMTRYSKIYILVDGLDELESGVRHDLIRSHANSTHSLNILVTARTRGRETQHFDAAPHLELKASDDDLHKYVAHRLHAADTQTLRKHIARDRTLTRDIQDNIVQKAQGMFLLARLHIGAIVGKHTIKAVRKALQTLPEGRNAVSETYDETISRIESDDEFDDNDLVPAPLLISSCAGLVTLEAQTTNVRFVHYTAQEYFETTRSRLFPMADSEIAKISLTYLALDRHALDPTLHSTEEFNARVVRTPFLGYAATFWGQHALTYWSALVGVATGTIDRVPRSWSELEELVDNFFDRHNQICCAKLSNLHLAARSGIVEAVQIIIDKLDNKTLVDIRDCEGRTALGNAASRGHVEVIECLVQAGANLDTCDSFGMTPLHLAAEAGLDTVI
ncbi:hypothetical protein K445DRAFT_47805, partial [Daldinia sp. EC12]